MVVEEINPDFVPWARIKVMWIGGWGWNTVDRMINEGLEGVEFISVNTDAQALANTTPDKKINIGMDITKGLGAWANPEIGQKAAEESIDEVKKHLQDTDMLFITAGMWGGTGTWAAPVIASTAKEMGILTVGVVTKPFSFEGKKRMQNALEWLDKMRNAVDTLIVIPNDKIFNIIDKKTTFKQSFSMIDKILYLGVQGISDLIIKPGDINTDFADIKVTMKDSGTALLGIWYGEGENRAVEAAKKAIDNPLLESNLEGAKNIIFAVTGGDDLTPMEVQEAARVLWEIVDPDANIIWGMSFDDSYDGEMKVTIVATGFPQEAQDNLIQWNSSQFQGFGWAGRKWQDFVNRAIWGSRRNKKRNSQNSSSSNSSDSKDSNGSESKWKDYDTPAFLRKRLNK